MKPDCTMAQSQLLESELSMLPAALQHHINTCPACREFASTLAQVSAHLQQPVPGIQRAKSIARRVVFREEPQQVFWQIPGISFGLSVAVVILFLGLRPDLPSRQYHISKTSGTGNADLTTTTVSSLTKSNNSSVKSVGLTVPRHLTPYSALGSSLSKKEGM
ncbi:hypothetical protein KKF84_19530 [Myxococcota bacterium]|nr:hypothetical protein [Myxococcota bacterium]MBU1537515.1 hypothetical protein [Myxococcota bacterium]